jgi:hypothetical protein
MIDYTLPIVAESWGLLAKRFNSLFFIAQIANKK